MMKYLFSVIMLLSCISGVSAGTGLTVGDGISLKISGGAAMKITGSAPVFSENSTLTLQDNAALYLPSGTNAINASTLISGSSGKNAVIAPADPNSGLNIVFNGLFNGAYLEFNNIGDGSVAFNSKTALNNARFTGGTGNDAYILYSASDNCTWYNLGFAYSDSKKTVRTLPGSGDVNINSYLEKSGVWEAGDSTDVENGGTVTWGSPVPAYTVTFTAGPGGSVSGKTVQTVYSGYAAEPVEAVPDAGYVFTAWSGDYSGTENPLTLRNITRNLTVNAEFKPAGTYTLLVNNGTGGGEYQEGEKVTITAATPPEGQEFYIWSGDTDTVEDLTAPETVLVMPGSDVSVTALYRESGLPAVYSVSGSVSGDVRQGVRVYADPLHYAVTSADGSYTIANLTAGSYNITPELDGFVFTPNYLRVEISDKSISGINFTAAVGDSAFAAVNDFYSLTADSTLEVSADKGVTANDLFSGNVNVVIINNPLHGTLQMNSDGSFVYEPERSFLGEDSFSYKLDSGMTASNTAEVKINIEPYKVTLGIKVEIPSEDVLKPGKTFAKPPKIYGTVNSAGKLKKVSLKKDKYLSTPELAVGIWAKKVPIYDKKAVKNGYNAYISSGSQNSEMVQLMVSGQTETEKFKGLKAKQVLLVPPEITDYTLNGQTLKISGKYFGSKIPKVLLEPVSGGKAVKLKVDKNSYKFISKTGESFISASFKPEKVIRGEYFIVIDNKIGIGVSYDSEGKQFLPQITIE
jgi:hypothetical protein